MQFPQPLERGVLVQRYKRFFADVVMDDGRAIIAHCPNPGSMLGMNTPGIPVWLSYSDNPKRKLAYTLELVEADGALIGVNTMHPAGGFAPSHRRAPVLSLYDLQKARA